MTVTVYEHDRASKHASVCDRDTECDSGSDSNRGSGSIMAVVIIMIAEVINVFDTKTGAVIHGT